MRAGFSGNPEFNDKGDHVNLKNVGGTQRETGNCRINFFFVAFFSRYQAGSESRIVGPR